MKKFEVTLRWTKKLDFPQVEAKDEKEALELAEKELASNRSLIEENDGAAEWEVTEVK